MDHVLAFCSVEQCHLRLQRPPQTKQKKKEKKKKQLVLKLRIDYRSKMKT